mgnify:CR=1 FL=1
MSKIDDVGGNFKNDLSEVPSFKPERIDEAINKILASKDKIINEYLAQKKQQNLEEIELSIQQYIDHYVEQIRNNKDILSEILKTNNGDVKTGVEQLKITNSVTEAIDKVDGNILRQKVIEQLKKEINKIASENPTSMNNSY